MEKILVLCTGNSCRSQMVHAYMEKYLGDKVKVYSAGVEIHGVNPRVVKVMAEDGIDISHHTSNNVSEYDNESFDYVITVCDHAREVCPYFPKTKKMLHHSFHDPATAWGKEEDVLKVFREVRDEIKAYCLEFQKKYDTAAEVR
ncbi:MAG: arsenate reductase ArsC [Chitinophagales bacterium]|nr:arsenate reductase ArsC [Chitinophagales bacterium]